MVSFFLDTIKDSANPVCRDAVARTPLLDGRIGKTTVIWCVFVEKIEQATRSCKYTKDVIDINFHHCRGVSLFVFPRIGGGIASCWVSALGRGADLWHNIPKGVGPRYANPVGLIHDVVLLQLSDTIVIDKMSRKPVKSASGKSSRQTTTWCGLTTTKER